jgi:glycosyltransferase involved in cell wall biosynthesis
LPDDLPKRYLDMVVNNWAIKVVDHFLPAEGLEDLLWNSDIFALPAARLHVVSILEAMAHGLALVTSDGWGINEYVEHGRTGMIVRGRFGKCSWTDERGLLREDYRSMFSPDPFVVSQLVDVISKLVEDKELREKLRENARADIENKFSAEKWVAGLKKAFDQALKN